MIRNRLTIVEEAEPYVDKKGKKQRKVKVRCVCGTEKVIYRNNVTAGRTVSCGCAKKEHLLGLSLHPLYDKYCILRVEGKLCQKWTKDAGTFFKWLKTKGYALESKLIRIDKKQPYSEKNCKLTTPDLKDFNDLVKYHAKTNPLLKTWINTC